MKHFDNALAHYANGELQEALAMLLPLVQQTESDGLPSPAQGQPLELLGQVWYGLGRPFEAVDAIEKASLVIPISDESQIVLASCYAELRRIDLARDLYVQLALSRRLSPASMLQVAAGLNTIGAPQLAMQVCEWIIEQDELCAQAYFDMGTYSSRSGNALYLTEALTRRAMQLDPDNLRYRIELVSLMIRLDRDDEAIVSLGAIASEDLRDVACESCLSRVAEMLVRVGDNTLAGKFQRQVQCIRASKASKASSVLSVSIAPHSSMVPSAMREEQA